MNRPAYEYPTHPVPFPERTARIESLLEFLRQNKKGILDLLTDHATYSAAEMELHSSIKTLEEAIREVGTKPQKFVERMAVFMPSNVVLYSYILYLVIPSLYIRSIDFRPSSYVSEQLKKLHQMLEPAHRLPITIQSVSQRIFMEESVRSANVVLFTGTYVNAEKIKSQLSENQMYIFFGQGVNPFVVSETADLNKAVDDLVAVRMFNTGQDCMGPDVIFIHQAAADCFLNTLRKKLEGLVFGSRKDPNADYASIYYSSTLDIIAQHLNFNTEFIHYGGVIDYSRKKIEPTVLYSSLAQRPDIIEFFGPIFNVVTYENDDALKAELNKGFYKERAMGASVYSNDALADFLMSNHTVSVNSTLFDIENGNKPFGGYGPMANYVYYQRQLTIAPILISQVVSDFF